MTPIDTNWDIDYYRKDYESEEHWNLKKKFIEAHKANIDEDRLVCLAQCFANIDFMGCKYPDETMQLVVNLTLDVAQEFREERKDQLKKYFVQASDVAEQKAKRGTEATKTPHNNKKKNKHKNKHKKLVKKLQLQSTCRYLDPKLGELAFDELKYKNFIYFIDKDNPEDMAHSANKSNRIFRVKEDVESEPKVVEFVLAGNIIGVSKGSKKSTIKSEAYELAKAELQKEAITLRYNLEAYQISITKDNCEISAFAKKSKHSTQDKAGVAIDCRNVGFKMMQKLGWSGGGLGSKNDGIEEPISLDGQKTRQGLGTAKPLSFEGDPINREYCKQLVLNYCDSDEIRDLKVTCEFTKQERGYFLSAANILKSLRTKSYGRGANRYCVISKRIPYERIAEEILVNDNEAFKRKYKLKVPDAWKDLFPNYTKPI